jgi:protein SCO1
MTNGLNRESTGPRAGLDIATEESAMLGRIFVSVRRHGARSRLLCALAFVLAAQWLGCGSAAAQTAAQGPQPSTNVQGRAAQAKTDASAESPAHRYFTDVVLVNQDGEKMRFYSDLLRDKVVIINSFFGTCKGSCLPMNRNLEKVQEALGDHIGRDVYIISISVDPTVDTPASLKEYAKKLNARLGWYFLTGDKENVDFALKKLGQFVTDKQDHLNVVIIGNEHTGLWKKAFGLAPSDDIVKVVQSVLDDKSTGGN